MKIQAIKNGVVFNTIQADESNLESSIAWLQAQGFTCVLNEQAGPGWTYDGDTFTPPVEVPVVVKVSEVTMRQARLALLQTDKLSAVVNALAQLPEPTKTAAGIEWEYSNTVNRNHPFTIQMIQILGLTESEADDLFALANTL